MLSQSGGVDASAADSAREEDWPQRITRGRKDVVTAFIQNPTDGSVLVVKRSDKVRTYKNYWGGVSGSVEGDESLFFRAQREVSLTNIWSLVYNIINNQGRALSLFEAGSRSAILRFDTFQGKKKENLRLMNCCVVYVD